jgi:hypothetical protein
MARRHAGSPGPGRVEASGRDLPVARRMPQEVRVGLLRRVNWSTVRRLGGRGVLRGVRREYRAASRRAARTRGFAAPAFAGCAFVVDGEADLEASTEAVKHLSDARQLCLAMTGENSLLLEQLPTSFALGIRPALDLVPPGSRLPARCRRTR